jgi:hypothetical protein
VPQQRLVGHLDQLVATGPVPAGDQEALVGEPSRHGLTRLAQLTEARAAAQVGTRLPHLDQSGEDAGHRVLLLPFQAGVDGLGAGDDGLLQAAHGAIGVQREGAGIKGPLGPELLQGELQQGQVPRLTEGVVQQDLHQGVRNRQPGDLRRAADHRLQGHAIQGTQVNDSRVGQARGQGLIVQHLAPVVGAQGKHQPQGATPDGLEQYADETAYLLPVGPRGGGLRRLIGIKLLPLVD